MLDTLLAAIPQPPVDEVMPKTAETIFNVFIFIPLGIALAVAIRHVRGGKGPLLLYCIIGGAFAATLEPVVDVLGLVYLKEHGAVGTFTVLGRTMPLYICFVYPWYVGGLGYLGYRLFDRGITRKALFQLWALDCVVDVFLETPGIVAKTYSYYGHQPFKVLGFPLWWGFVNPIMPMIAGAMIFRLLPQLRGWQLLAVIPIIPMADGLANGATAWPMWVTLNQHDVSYVVTYLAGFVTLGLALYAVWMISFLVVRPAEEIGELSIFARLRALAEPPDAVAPSRIPMTATR
jgi:hypothetical protein